MFITAWFRNTLFFINIIVIFYANATTNTIFLGFFEDFASGFSAATWYVSVVYSNTGIGSFGVYFYINNSTRTFFVASGTVFDVFTSGVDVYYREFMDGAIFRWRSIIDAGRAEFLAYCVIIWRRRIN